MYQVRPFEGVAEARFGEQRATLHARLGQHETFRKGGTQIGLTDHYVELGLILHHDHLERLYYLELTDPDTVYEDVPLLELPYQQVRDELAAHGARYVEMEYGGWDFPDLGFHLWRGGNDHETAEVVGMYPRGYRDAIGGFVGASPTPIKRHTLIPHVGIELAQLGDSRDELRERLGGCLESVPPYGPAAVDSYIDHGLELGFDESDHMISIAISSLAESVTYEGVELYHRPYPDVVADLATRGTDVEHGELIVRAPGFDLLLCNPRPDALVAAIRIATVVADTTR
ncbi:hypothetical protein ACQP0C_13910 [Nocardia sp. CA-129566]|uniref:hypothetical protein n=1 Tax=Nocardia sp. CA-129566 TaxID=3239976 RepID=UPI003D98FD1D